MEYLGAWGALIHEKNLKSKISCQTSFKQKDCKFLNVHIFSKLPFHYRTTWKEDSWKETDKEPHGQHHKIP